MSDKPLDASGLKTVLEKLSQPGALQNDEFLQSWIVQECLRSILGAETWTAEYLSGRALERQLQQWSEEFRFDASYRKG